MGFTQLLVANRGLRNIRSGPSRYKMTQANLLPRFGTEKDVKAASRPPSEVANAPTGNVAPVLPSEAPATASAPAASVPAVAVSPAVASKPRKARWSMFGNPFGEGKRATETRPVQTELLLADVKPVRNRLGDDEFEPVRTTRDAVRAPATALVAAPVRPANAAGFWRRWKSRLFGASRT